MKKIITAITALMILSLMCLSMTACSGVSDGRYELESITIVSARGKKTVYEATSSNTYVGEYTLIGINIKVNENEVDTLLEGSEFEEIFPKDVIVVNIQENNKVKLDYNMPAIGMVGSDEGTWEIKEDNKIVCTDDTDDPMDLTITGSEMKIIMPPMPPLEIPGIGVINISGYFYLVNKNVSQNNKVTQSDFVLTVNKDGTFTRNMTLRTLGFIGEESGKWEIKNDDIYFIADDQSFFAASKDGNKLVLHEGGDGDSIEVVLKKVK